MKFPPNLFRGVRGFQNGRVAVAMSGLMIAGCGGPVGPDFESPTAAMPGSYRYESRKNGKAAAARESWWRIFGDAGLNRLVSQVRAGNNELQAGLKRIEQARALVRIAGAEALPQVAASPSARRSRVSDEVVGSGTGSVYTAPLSVDWEIDLFGRIRRGQ